MNKLSSKISIALNNNLKSIESIHKDFDDIVEIKFELNRFFASFQSALDEAPNYNVAELSRVINDAMDKIKELADSEKEFEKFVNDALKKENLNLIYKFGGSYFDIDCENIYHSLEKMDYDIKGMFSNNYTSYNDHLKIEVSKYIDKTYVRIWLINLGSLDVLFSNIEDSVIKYSKDALIKLLAGDESLLIELIEEHQEGNDIDDFVEAENDYISLLLESLELIDATALDDKEAKLSNIQQKLQTHFDSKFY